MTIPSFEEMNHLVEAGFVSRKLQEQNGEEFYIFKYKNKVFYKNLWNRSEALLESRGIVFDKDGCLVQLPLKKVFNHGENGVRVDPSRKVIASVKYNGFMLAVSRRNGDLLFSTTGSLNSDYVRLGRESFFKYTNNHDAIIGDYTFIFEVCVPEDPHIVYEEPGLKLLAVRDKVTGRLLSPGLTFNLSDSLGAKTEEPTVMSFGRVLEASKSVLHEGFMVTDYETGEHLVKLKSPHYLSKKFLMRMSDRLICDMFENPEKFKRKIDEEFYGLVDFIIANLGSPNKWMVLNDQERRSFIESFYGG